MKTLMTSLAAAAAILAAGAGTFSDTAKFEGLFGHKFGERIAATAPTIPSGDGTLISTIEPKNPEFALSEYWLTILPQSRLVCGFIGATSFALTEREKCDACYERLLKAVGKRFGKMQKFPPSDPGLGESTKTVRNDIVAIGNDRIVMMQTLRSPAGYTVRLIALDIKMSKRALDEHEDLAKKIPPLTGLFGQQLATVIRVSDTEEVLANGIHLQTFEPKKPFLDFNLYILQILPKSRKTFAITGVKNFEERFEASQCFQKVSGLLEKKFGIKLSNCTANYSTDKPDEAGEQMLHAAGAVFPDSRRCLEIQCLHDVDDKVFRVRVTAADAELMDLLEAETKAVKKAQDDSEALDAL